MNDSHLFIKTIFIYHQAIQIIFSLTFNNYFKYKKYYFLSTFKYLFFYDRNAPNNSLETCENDSCHSMYHMRNIYITTRHVF